MCQGENRLDTVIKIRAGRKRERLSVSRIAYTASALRRGRTHSRSSVSAVAISVPDFQQKKWNGIARSCTEAHGCRVFFLSYTTQTHLRKLGKKAVDFGLCCSTLHGMNDKKPIYVRADSRDERGNASFTVFHNGTPATVLRIMRKALDAAGYATKAQRKRRKGGTDGE